MIFNPYFAYEFKNQFMKKSIYYLAGLTLLVGLSSFAYRSINISSPDKGSSEKMELVSFYLKGTGSKDISVKVGVGSKIGYGSCCRTVSPNSTVSFQGEIGDVVYDSERKRVILKVYNGIKGTTTDLKDYY
jgi:hypothetical protein